jgi:hypothetical protein
MFWYYLNYLTKARRLLGAPAPRPRQRARARPC